MIAFCDDLRAYVSEKHHFPNKYTQLLNRIKFVIGRSTEHIGGVETEDVPRYSGDAGYGRAYWRVKEEGAGGAVEIIFFTK